MHNPLLFKNYFTAYFRRIASETDNLFLPLALREANTLRPFAVDIRSLKPCLLRFFLTEG